MSLYRIFQPAAGHIALFFMAAVISTGSSQARVVRFVVEEKRPFANGKSFGDVGPYERLDGMAYFEVAPESPLNAVIFNLDKAPRNIRGTVAFSAPFFILKPVDMRRSNHKIFYGINNRGNKQALGYFNFVPNGPGINNPLQAAAAGDGFLMRLGYVLVDAGWQGDVVNINNQLAANLPVAKQRDGSPIVAKIRIEYSDRTIPETGTFALPLEGSESFRPYRTAERNTASSTLTVRDPASGPSIPISPDQWAFGTCPTGKASLAPDDSSVCLFEGFKPTRLYQLTYPAKDPLVLGLGYAVTRDIGSFLRYSTQDSVGNSNPLGPTGTADSIRRAYSFGGSSTGMYQREFLFLGFNEDEEHRKVFDAMWIHKPGTYRLFANVEFADPNTYSLQEDRHDFLSNSHPPLTFAITTDPVSGITDGLVKRPETDPLIFQSDTASEFWQMKASLNVMDGSGKPVPIPGNVRLYFLSSFEHSGLNPPVRFPEPLKMCQNLTNPNYHGPTLRALLMALDAWADKGVKPPPSNYPRLDNGTLISRKEAEQAYSQIPGLNAPTVMNELTPSGGQNYRLYVPKPDEDGLDIAGVRPLEIRVPLGTNTGWNVRARGFRQPNLCALNGSFIPFAPSKTQRVTAGDSRLSIEERYKNHKGYVRAVENAARELVHERFLLTEDASRFIAEAKASQVLK